MRLRFCSGFHVVEDAAQRLASAAGTRDSTRTTVRTFVDAAGPTTTAAAAALVTMLVTAATAGTASAMTPAGSASAMTSAAVFLRISGHKRHREHRGEDRHKCKSC